MSSCNVFLSVDKVKDRLDQYTVFDARYSLADPQHLQGKFGKGHLPGARMALMDKHLAAPPRNGARHPLPKVEDFIEWCKANGITKEKPVLCYDDLCGGMGGCRLWWMLQSLGVEAYVLDGGYQAYCKAGGAVETGAATEIPPASAWDFQERYHHHLTIKEIPPEGVMVDARAAPRYQYGVRTLFAGDPLPGHIEGALNLPFLSNTTTVDGTLYLRPEEEIRENILAVVNGKTNLSKYIFSCGSGITACFNIAVATHVGLGTPYLYCGSWSEYATVYHIPLSRQIVERFGLYIEMRSPCLLTAPKAEIGVHRILVDGKETSQPSDGVRKAVQHLHVGERGKVHLKGGRVFLIEVMPRPKI